MPPTEDAEDDLQRNARAVLAAEHQRFVDLAANARAYRAGLPTRSTQSPSSSTGADDDRHHRRG